MLIPRVGNVILRPMKKVVYSKLPTEQSNPRTQKIDRLPIKKILFIMNEEDRQVPAAVSKVQNQIAGGVRLIVSSIQKGGRIFLAGAGTSGRLAVLEAAECPPTFNTPPSLVQAVIAGGRRAVFRSQEGAEDRDGEAFKIFQKKLRRGDVLIGIAASGVTPFVKGALRAAKKRKSSTILIACNATSPLGNLVNCLISPAVGPEVITGSTRLKAGTATKLILNMLTVTSMIKLGKVYQNWMVDLQPKSKKLKARAVALIERLGKVSPKKAEHYLIKARNRVKAAILMARKGWAYSRAVHELKKSSGFLLTALER